MLLQTIPIRFNAGAVYPVTLQGEHNTIRIAARLPERMADTSLFDYFVCLFKCDDTIVKSPLIYAGSSGNHYFNDGAVYVMLWQQLTECRTLQIQIIGYRSEGGEPIYIAKTPLSETLVFDESLTMADIESTESPDLISQILAALPTPEQKTAIEKMSDVDGELSYNGKTYYTYEKLFHLLAMDSILMVDNYSDLLVENAQNGEAVGCRYKYFHNEHDDLHVRFDLNRRYGALFFNPSITLNRFAMRLDDIIEHLSFTTVTNVTYHLAFGLDSITHKYAVRMEVSNTDMEYYYAFEDIAQRTFGRHFIPLKTGWNKITYDGTNLPSVEHNCTPEPILDSKCTRLSSNKRAVEDGQYILNYQIMINNAARPFPYLHCYPEGLYYFSNSTWQLHPKTIYRRIITLKANGWYTNDDANDEYFYQTALVDGVSRMDKASIKSTFDINSNGLRINWFENGYIHFAVTTPPDEDITVELKITRATERIISWQLNENVTISVTDGDGNTYESGDEIPVGTRITITATCADGYELDELLVGTYAVENNYQMWMCFDTEITTTVTPVYEL